jgi:hypothetical protein
MSQPCSFFHGQTSPIRPKSARWPVVWASLCCTLLLSLPAMARTAQPLPVAMPEASAALAAPALPASSPAPLSQAAAELLSWIAQTGNHAGAPYVVVDKRQARAWVFDAQHRLLGASPALLGLTVGDREAADITQRDVTRLSKDARITPAGRFASEPGVNLQGEDVIWLDYAAGLALHRVRPGSGPELAPASLGSRGGQCAARVHGLRGAAGGFLRACAQAGVGSRGWRGVRAARAQPADNLAAKLVCAHAHRERAMKAMSVDSRLAELGQTLAMRQL